MERPADQQPSRPAPLPAGLAAARPFGSDGEWSRGATHAHREGGTTGGSWSRWQTRPVLAAVPLAIGLLAGTGYWLLAPASYQSSASLVVQPLVSDQFGATDPAHLVDMATEVQLAQSSAVATGAGQRLHLAPDAVRAALDVQSPPGTEVLTVTFRAGSPAAAASGAQAVADAYLAYREASAGADADRRLASVQKQIDDVTLKLAQRPAGQAAPYQDALRALLTDQRTLTAVKATTGGRVISTAVPPAGATSPKALVDIPLGGLAGVLVGLVLAVLPRSRRLAAAASPRSSGTGRASGAPARPGPGRGAGAVTRPAGSGRPGTRSAAGSRPGPTSPSATGLGSLAAALGTGAGPAGTHAPAEAGQAAGASNGAAATAADPGTNRVISLAAVSVPADLPGTPAGPGGSAGPTGSAGSASSAGSAGPAAVTSTGVPAQAASPLATAERLPVVNAQVTPQARISTPVPVVEQQPSTIDEELIAKYVAIAEQPSIIDGIEPPPPVEPPKPSGPPQPWYRTDGGRRRTHASDEPDELGVDLWSADR